MTSLSFSINHTSSHTAGQRLQSKAKVHLAEYTIHTWPWQCPLTSSLLEVHSPSSSSNLGDFLESRFLQGSKRKGKCSFPKSPKGGLYLSGCQGTTSAQRHVILTVSSRSQTYFNSEPANLQMEINYQSHTCKTEMLNLHLQITRQFELMLEVL